MAKFRPTSKRPHFQKNEFGKNLRRMFSLFDKEKKVMTFVIVMSIIEAVMITFTTFCVCIIYSNFFAKEPSEAQTFLDTN